MVWHGGWKKIFKAVIMSYFGVEMKIIYAIFIGVLLTLFLVRCGSGSETYEFSWPQSGGTHGVMRQFYSVTEIFWLHDDGVDIRGNMINAPGSPFDGEVIVFVGTDIMLFGEYMYHYHIIGNRLFFDLQISTPHGIMHMEDLWAFGFGRAAARYDEPVVWLGAELNPISPPDGLIESEARALRYLFTVAILEHRLHDFFPNVRIYWIFFVIAGVSFVSVVWIKIRGENEKEAIVLQKVLTFTYWSMFIMFVAGIIWRF